MSGIKLTIKKKPSNMESGSPENSDVDSSPDSPKVVPESLLKDFEVKVLEESSTHSPSVDNAKDSSKRSDIPAVVKASSKSGVEEHSLTLAKAFMTEFGDEARRCSKRGELSSLYIKTQSAWMNAEWLGDKSLQRPFSQILFAIAHGMKLVRVVNSGRNLVWNRNRDNNGEEIERRDNHRNQHHGRRRYRSRSPVRREDRYRNRRYDDEDDHHHRDHHHDHDHRRGKRDDDWKTVKRHRDYHDRRGGERDYTPKPDNEKPCFAHQRGECERGESCKFSHEDSICNKSRYERR